MGLVQQALHGLVDLHLLYLLGADRAELAVGHQLGLLLGELGVFIAQLEGSLIVLVDHVVKEQGELFKTAGGLLRRDADHILAVGDEEQDEFLAESNEGV